MEHNLKELLKNWHERVFDKKRYVENFIIELRRLKIEAKPSHKILTMRQNNETRVFIDIDEVLGDSE